MSQRTKSPDGSNERSPLIPRGSGALGSVTPSTPSTEAKKRDGTPAPSPPTMLDLRMPRISTNSSWPQPAGLPIRSPNDENLLIFRRALGINNHSPTPDSCTLEEGRKTATGIYHAVLRQQAVRRWQYTILNTLLYVCYFAQILIGAVLTALGPGAASHAVVITVLGAANTVIAGVLALIKGQGLPERLRRDEVEFRKLQDWIEETEALLAVGVIGQDRKEVGLLVEVAFRKYNAAKASVENNRPESYVRQMEDEEDAPEEGGNVVVKWNAK